MAKGDTVTLIESLGPVLVTVPNVRAMGVRAAETVMADAGFKTKVQAVAVNYLGLGYVVYTNPRARSRRRRARRSPSTWSDAAGCSTRGRGRRPRRPTLARCRCRDGQCSSSALLVTAAWGSTFFLIKDLVTRIPVADLLAVRFAIASLALARRSPGPASGCPQSCCAGLLPRPALRHRPDPADRRAGPHRGQRLRVHHRPVRRAHAAARVR